MATQTKNYKFKKPDRKEFFNVADLNDNLDAIDGVLGEKQEAEVKDTNNILGTGLGKKALIQTLFDSIGDWFINKLVTNDNFVSKFSERLVNNGTANLEGFALDARQGNPTVPGSMAKQISELNSQKQDSLFLKAETELDYDDPSNALMGGWIANSKVGYYNLKLGNWIIIQFRVTESGIPECRAKYGANNYSEWKAI